MHSRSLSETQNDANDGWRARSLSRSVQWWRRRLQIELRSSLASRSLTLSASALCLSACLSVRGGNSFRSFVGAAALSEAVLSYALAANNNLHTACKIRKKKKKMEDEKIFSIVTRALIIVHRAKRRLVVADNRPPTTIALVFASTCSSLPSRREMLQLL